MAHENPLTRALSLGVAGGGAHEPWITTLTAALADVAADEAAWKPAADERSIWEIVEHVREWTGWVVGFLDGRDTDVVDWPVIQETSPAAWAAATARLQETLDAFQSAVDSLADRTLLESPTPVVTATDRITGIVSIAVHNAYHAGQITKLRDAYARASRR